MAMSSYLLTTAAPRSVHLREERACPSSHSSELAHFSRLLSSFRIKLVSAQRTSSCDALTWRSSKLSGALSCRPTAPIACVNTAITPQQSLHNVVPASVLAGAPMLLGALVPVVFTMYLSKKLNLGLEKEIRVAVFRAAVQLSTLGLALKVVFEGQSVALSIFAMIIMVVAAGYTSGERSKLLPRSKLVSIVALVVGAFGTIWLMVLFRVFPLEPKYLIPATGSLVGNSMTVLAVTLNGIHDDICLHEQEIEAALALGATPHQAIAEHLRKCLIRGLGPILDYMKVTGLVTLPGAMTGMLMSGSHPLEAVRFSLVLLYMLVGASSLSGVIGAQLGWRSLFSSSMQLLIRTS